MQWRQNWERFFYWATASHIRIQNWDWEDSAHCCSSTEQKTESTLCQHSSRHQTREKIQSSPLCLSWAKPVFVLKTEPETDEKAAKAPLGAAFITTSAWVTFSVGKMRAIQPWRSSQQSVEKWVESIEIKESKSVQRKWNSKKTILKVSL